MALDRKAQRKGKNYMRELSYKALLYMEGQDVNVIDLEYDCYI